MLKILSHRITIVLLAVLALITLLFSIFYRPKPATPKLLEVSPKDRSEINYFDEIRLRLDKAINQDGLVVNSIPEEEWEILVKPNSSLIVKSKKYLQVNTQYLLNITYQNSPIASLTYTVKPQQSDPRYAQEVAEEIKRDYPLAAKIPYEAPGFTVLYKSPMTFEITLKEGVEERSEIINAVRDWVKENGLDPDSHTYTFSN
jgi:hypothetical protein